MKPHFLTKTVEYLYWLFALTLVLGQLARISLYNQRINVYAYEAIIIVLILLVVAKYGVKFIITKLAPAIKVMILVIIISIVTNILNYTPMDHLVALAYTGRWLLYILFFAATCIVIEKKLVKQTQLTNIISTIFFVFAATCLAQLLLLPNIGALQYYGWDPHNNRAVGTLLDASAAAALLGIACLWFNFYGKNMSLMFAALFATSLSRGAMVSIIGALLLGITRNRLYPASLITLLAVFVFLSFKPTFNNLPNEQDKNIIRTGSVYSRIDDYKQGFVLFMQKPLLGHGYNYIRTLKIQPQQTQDANHAGGSFHSTFLIILVTTGIIGFAAFCYMLYSFAIINALTMQITIFLSVFSIFDNILLYPHIFVTYLFVVVIQKMQNTKYTSHGAIEEN
jgi:hypothetical protein